MRRGLIALATVAATALLVAGCGGADEPDRTGTAQDEAAPASSSSGSASGSASREDAVVAWLQDPAQGFGLSDTMAACEAGKLLGSDLPAATVDKVVSPDVQATQEETSAFMAALGEADQTCVAENPDDPAAP